MAPLRGTRPRRSLTSLRVHSWTGLTLFREATAGLSHFLNKFLKKGTVIASQLCLALGIFICVSAGWLARVPVCDRWGGLWRQTCAFLPHVCLVHSSFRVSFSFFSRHLRSVSLLSYCLLSARMTSKEFTGLAQRSVLFRVDTLPSCRESPAMLARMLIDIKFCLPFQFFVSCDWTH